VNVVIVRQDSITLPNRMLLCAKNVRTRASLARPLLLLANPTMTSNATVACMGPSARMESSANRGKIAACRDIKKWLSQTLLQIEAACCAQPACTAQPKCNRSANLGANAD